METTIIYWGYLGDNIGRMEKKMEATVFYLLFLFVLLGILLLERPGSEGLFLFSQETTIELYGIM